jgi:hypothetical protein
MALLRIQTSPHAGAGDAVKANMIGWHNHGDGIFGLAGLLESLAQSLDKISAGAQNPQIRA